MDLQNILSEIEKVDPEIYERLDSRRGAMKQFANVGKVLALTAIPLALGSMFKKAYGRTPSTVFDVLNYALTLEYLEAAFYKKGNETVGLIPAGPAVAALATIGAHETAHVAFLKSAISANGGTPVNSPTFDFTAGGNFPDVFTNYNTFLAIAQTFEDTGVRAYKGAAPDLAGTGDILSAALSIHSVEARHAAHLRAMRRARGQFGASPALMDWITLNQSGIATPLVNPSYAGEENTIQANIQITNIAAGITADAASESFDEPLSQTQVLAIAGQFIVR
jgi:hypothetical protein